MKIRTLENISEADLLNAFNTAFSDYSIPFRLDIGQLRSKIKTENINFEYSVGAFNGDKLVGFILHGVKGVNHALSCYNAGTGVIPTERGNGLTLKMYEYILPKLKSKNVINVTLEVISDNVAAIKSYKNVGFDTVRLLNCFRGGISENVIDSKIEVALIKNPDLDLLSLMGESQPTWQNSTRAIENMSNEIIVIGAYKENDLVGYAAVNIERHRILQIGIKKEMTRQKTGSILLDYIRNNISKQVSIINVDAASESTTMLLELSGLTNFLQQYEMNLILKK